MGFVSGRTTGSRDGHGHHHNVALGLPRPAFAPQIIRRAAEAEPCHRLVDTLRLKYGRLKDSANTCPGATSKKTVLAKWLARRPSVLIVDEPTRGIDVGTKAEVHRLLDEVAHQGVAVLMISSELPEVLGMADRILVLERDE